MRETLERISESKLTIAVLGFALLLSLFSNVYLFVESIRLNNEIEVIENDTNEIANDTPGTETEAINIALEREIDQLEEQIDLLMSETEDDIILDENIEVRSELVQLAEEFSTNYLNYDSNNSSPRDEVLSPYVTEQLNQTLNQNDFEYVEDNDNSEHNEDSTDVNYLTTVNRIETFINEATIGEDNSVVFVRAEVDTTIDDLSTLSERMILELRVNNTEDGYKVNNFYYYNLD